MIRLLAVAAVCLLHSAPAAAAPAKSGIYPVYEIEKQWVLLDRAPEDIRARLKKGRDFLVIGSRGAEIFRIGPPMKTMQAACVKQRPMPTQGYVLIGRRTKPIGTPVIAVHIPKGRRGLSLSQAQFYRMENTVSEDVYASMGIPIREAAAADLKSGEFKISADDPQGKSLAPDAKIEDIQMKIDFAATIRLAGGKQGFVTIEGLQFSKSFRRCLRLFVDDKPVGRCAEMPNTLMAETNQLNFVAYDPSPGHPFILAYTPKGPYWGDERWGFQLVSKAGSAAPQGIRRFLLDALDPKCREKL